MSNPFFIEASVLIGRVKLTRLRGQGERGGRSLQDLQTDHSSLSLYARSFLEPISRGFEN